ncbi:unnamed protein product [Trichogramma brassicae]|uniref:Uncharacterized protein n=1 Tax=Trichogramma brassicae TaxID=86971 RepID=A0A6H5I6F3_9HYME|nr:unnamed protein product [Trichogramma brassicae]
MFFAERFTITTAELAELGRTCRDRLAMSILFVRYDALYFAGDAESGGHDSRATDPA